MTSSPKSILDLFILVTDSRDYSNKLAKELLVRAQESLLLIDPAYVKKGCQEVLDGLEAQKLTTDHDLAVLCYEVISYVEYKIQGKK